MDSDGLSGVLDDAYPSCPRCLVRLEEEDETGVALLQCPSCRDVFF